ncbi:DUF2007 domain-containing protein [Myxococcota bacterium]|nr:DUF2007 domain-containing protein [Myxococcota bacterium]
MRIFSSPDRLMVCHLANLLRGEGIACGVRNQMLSAAAGELPPIECWPEIWVVDGAQAERARLIVREALRDVAPPGPGWACGGCGEEVEGQFTECWRCGRPRLALADP